MWMKHNNFDHMLNTIKVCAEIFEIGSIIYLLTFMKMSDGTG